MSLRVLRPPVLPHGSDAYAQEREPEDPQALDRLFDAGSLALRQTLGGAIVRRPLEKLLRAVVRRGAGLSARSDDDLLGRLRNLRPLMRRERLSGQATLESFALVREMAARKLGLRPFDVQMLGSLAMFHGLLVEMETGEGKTLTATVAAAVAALAGVPVHVITVNDYLAARDHAFAEPLLTALGLTCGLVAEGADEEARRTAYAAAVVHGTNKQIVFDYLRDRVQLARVSGGIELKASWLADPQRARGRLLLRGLHMGIIDEADSILIDEARTPLVLSRKRANPQEEAVAREALQLADALVESQHYRVLGLERRVELTDPGKDRLAEVAADAGPLLRGRRRREEAVVQALYARHLLRRDEHYLVQDSKVQIVDEYTGRLMADRSWSLGLHQMVEIKEDCPPSDQNETLAQITYQRFFRRYRHLAGMTGTAREVEGELWAVYRLPLIALPTRVPSRRVVVPAAVSGSSEDKWARIVDRVGRLSREGCPVLIGTRTVRASTEVSDRLQAAGIVHQVLNAANHADEARIVAQAGQAGQVTVATNLAGRGTDIKLGDGVVDLGGLVVILTERHDAGRIDRQLIGRCARQGDPGLAEAYLALDDDQFRQSSLHFLAPLLARLTHGLPWLGQPVSRWAFDRAQREQERLHQELREACVEQDRQLARMLAFSGAPE